MRLLRTGSPKSDESFIGYLLRLTEMNGYQTLSWMLQITGIRNYVQSKLSFAFDESLDLSPLARLSGTDKPALSSLQYLPVNKPRRKMGEYSVFGSPVSQYMIRLRYPKVCPACLGEAGYARKIWELAPVTACPIHRCQLIDECPCCKRRISWARHSVSLCQHCDFDWRGCEAQAVADSELRVSRQLHLYCNLPLSKSTIDPETKNNPISNTDLKSFLSALFFIASQHAGLMDTKGKHLAPSMRNAEIHILLCKAWAVFDKWPDNYFDFLDWRRTQIRESQSAHGLQRDFAQYKSSLYKQLTSPQLSFLRIAFEEYLITRWDGGYTNHLRRFDDAARCNGKYASRREAKKLLKVGVKSIDNLIAAGRLKAVVRRQGNTRLILIERASLLNFKRELEQSLYLKQVQGILGVTHERALELINCKLLNPLRGRSVDGCSDWRFSEKEVKGLLEQIKKKVTPVTSVGTDGTISFLMAFRKLGRAQISMGQFIRDIIDDEIYPCGISSKQGLAAIQLSKKQVTEYVYKRIHY
ncbi:MAG TPA: TniQ family protein [Pyrinomonadaceae bacterium]|nr:TniQ family protein [Pyrinomonadaceae bacterium]